MKTHSAKLKLIICFWGLLSLCGSAIGQPPPPSTFLSPAHPDFTWVPAMPWKPFSLNTAAIAYRNAGSGIPFGLYGSVLPVSVDPLSVPVEYANDTVRIMNVQNTGTSVVILGMVTTTTSNNSRDGADMIIGNVDRTTPRLFDTCNDFIAAVTYADMDYHPRIDFYKISKVPFSITLISTQVLSAYITYDVHIDVIANYGDLRKCGVSNDPGLPYCGKFMISFSDTTTVSAPPQVWAAYGDLTLQSLTLGPINVGGNVGTRPDIAAVQRVVPFWAGGTGGVDDVAYITYIGPLPAGGLYTEEWDATTVTQIGPTILQDPATPPVGSRIDAVDDYNLSSSVVQYKVAATVLNMAITPNVYEIRSYDDVNPAYDIVSQYDDPMGCGLTPSHAMVPQVSVWGANDFAIIHPNTPVNPLIWPYKNEVLMVDPIDNNYPSSYFANSIYQVNGTSCGAGYHGAQPDFYSSIAATPNYMGLNQPVLFSWNVYDGPITPPAPPVLYNFRTNFKFTTGTPGTFGPGGFSGFRTSETTAVPEKVISGEWAIFPNPASETLSLKCPQGTTGQHYEIIDVLGKTVQKGDLSANVAKINIGKLLPGTYSIRIENDKNEIKALSFVKN